MEDIEYYLEYLEKLQNEHLEKVNQMTIADNANLYFHDLIAIPVFNRSISLISGFCLLIRNENFICAAPLIRLQLDNAIRFYASFLINDNEFLKKLINGESIGHIKDPITKKNFTDTFLLEKLCEKIKQSDNESEWLKNNWLKNVYINTSGYIHLSEKHFFNATEKNDAAKIRLKVGIKDSYITDQNKLEAIGIMIGITKLVMWLLDSWTYTKINKSITL